MQLQDAVNNPTLLRHSAVASQAPCSRDLAEIDHQLCDAQLAVATLSAHFGTISEVATGTDSHVLFCHDFSLMCKPRCHKIDCLSALRVLS